MRISKYLLLVSGILLIFFFSNCTSPNFKDDSKTVYIKENGDGYQLIRNGQPFFIKGVSGSSFLPELVNAGGNTVRIYDTLNLRSRLDEIDSLGLAAIIDIHLPKFYGNDGAVYRSPKNIKKLEVDLEKFINTYKNHPALLFWILGNEVYYPELFSNDFVTVYNRLLAIIHDSDPNHPVSTTVSASGLKKVFSILVKSPELDFISVNNFGSLHDFEYDKKLLFFWQKPYMISEWGIHGPWEANRTEWSAPIELSSTEKALQYRNQYLDYIEPIHDNRFLGSLVFYWGQKQEKTHTWFSLFTREGKKTQVVYEMERIWKDIPNRFDGAAIKALTINGKEANQNIILNSGDQATAQLQIFNLQNTDYKKFNWEIKPENWNISPNDIEKEPITNHGLILEEGATGMVFKAPKNEGPYRLFVQCADDKGYVATANIPFYVIREKE